VNKGHVSGVPHNEKPRLPTGSSIGGACSAEAVYVATYQSEPQVREEEGAEKEVVGKVEGLEGLVAEPG
jgi:hypothetical protein